MKWEKPRYMKDAPRDGTSILLKTTCHGLVEAWYYPGEWVTHHEYGDEYNGPVWVCADDAFQIEVEELEKGEFHDGTAAGWWPIPDYLQTLKKSGSQ